MHLLHKCDFKKRKTLKIQETLPGRFSYLTTVFRLGGTCMFKTYALYLPGLRKDSGVKG